MYTQFFTNKSTIKNMEHLLPGSAKHISCNALLLFIFASQELPLYSSVDYLKESCCTVLTDKFKEKFFKALQLQVNDRSYKRYIKELVDAGLLRLVNKKERSYFVNPFLSSKIGDAAALQYMRECFFSNEIFSGNQSQSAEKYCKLFLNLDNVGKYSAFAKKKINYTELRACLVSSENDTNKSKSEHLKRILKKALTIFPESTAFIEPAQRTFNNPALWKDFKSMKYITFDNLNFSTRNSFDFICKILSSISTIYEYFFT